jgi:tryptophan synthase beta chain
MDTIQFTLPQSRIPRAWYNILADLPRPLAPVLHPGTMQPIGPDDLAPIFPMSLILQEVSTEREIEIPEPVRQVYAQWRPSPLFRARRLEKALDTPAHIYYKYEGVSPAGSHKPNTAVPQAFYNKQAGTQRLTTETGAGQWGSALAMASAFFGLECKVYMVRVSYDQKPYRRALIEAFGASVTASPSNETETGRAILAEHPHSNGSLGIAISEAVEMAAKDPHTKYALGSVLNHVLLHQTVIGQEAMEQMAMAGEEPDVIFGCAGGGSNFAGLAMPYVGRKIKGQCHARIVAVEPASPMTLAIPAISRRWSRCTPWAAPSSLPAFMPADCAITAWRRWSRTSWIWA